MTVLTIFLSTFGNDLQTLLKQSVDYVFQRVRTSPSYEKNTPLGKVGSTSA